MKTYRIPIIYQRVDTFEVDADNLQEAMTLALQNFYKIPDSKYLCNSAEFDSVIEDYNEDYDIDLAFDEADKQLNTN